MPASAKILRAALASLTWLLPAADYPEAEIANREVRVKLYLPDARSGYYRATRFDWSGIVHSLRYKGHEFFGPWFDGARPEIRDFIHEGGNIVAGPCSAVTGPAEEFSPLGWEQAKPGGNFVKIGVGTLRKPAEDRYDNFRLYEIADTGRWTVRRDRTSVEFVQDLSDSASGYAYTYRKTVRLAGNGAGIVLEHSLKNRGSRAIATRVYNHNFLVLDRQPPGPDSVITVPFEIRSPRPPEKRLAGIRGNRIVYVKTLEGSEVARTPIEGFGGSSRDHEIRIENSRLGVGVKITGDRPLVNAALWSIRTVLSVEPFIAVATRPGEEFTWTWAYEFYPLPARGR